MGATKRSGAVALVVTAVIAAGAVPAAVLRVYIMGAWVHDGIPWNSVGHSALPRKVAQCFRGPVYFVCGGGSRSVRPRRATLPGELRHRARQGNQRPLLPFPLPGKDV